MRQIIRAAASGERISYAGELFRVRNLQLRWLESAAPAIHVGASQQQMLRMAARCADGIMMSDMPPGPASQAIAILDAALAEHGRQRPAFATNVLLPGMCTGIASRRGKQRAAGCCCGTLPPLAAG